MPGSVDLSEFTDIGPPNQRGGRCWWLRLSEEQQAKVIAAQAAGYNYTQISRVMSSRWGIEVGSKTVGTHLRLDCSCGK